jgi:hypothetical protein
LNIEFWRLIFFSKKRQLVSPFLLERDGRGFFLSLLSESQTSDLTLAQNEPPAFTLIFFIILFVNMRQPRTIYHLAMLALRLFFNLQPKVID